MNQKIIELNATLLTMTGSPRLHVNGPSHPTALLTVDFGQSIGRPVEIPAEQFDLLTRGMRAAGATLARRGAEVRIQVDASRGIYWAAQA